MGRPWLRPTSLRRPRWCFRAFAPADIIESLLVQQIAGAAVRATTSPRPWTSPSSPVMGNDDPTNARPLPTWLGFYETNPFFPRALCGVGERGRGINILRKLSIYGRKLTQALLGARVSGERGVGLGSHTSTVGQGLAFLPIVAYTEIRVFWWPGLVIVVDDSLHHPLPCHLRARHRRTSVPHGRKEWVL